MITITCGSERAAGDCAMSVALLDGDESSGRDAPGAVDPQAATVARSAPAVIIRPPVISRPKPSSRY
jgi:hypothetical protein